MVKERKKIRVGVSVGDLNGIGMEVIIKTFEDKRMMDFCTPIIFGSSKVISHHRKALDYQDFSFNIPIQIDSCRLIRLIRIRTNLCII